MSAFHNLYSCILNRLFYLVKVRTLRISVFHKHTGTEVYSIKTILFEGIHQTVHSSALTASACKKGDHLSVFIVGLKV